MTDTWKRLDEITARISGILPPVPFEVTVPNALAVAIFAEATKAGIKPETIILEAVRSYLGEG